MNTKFSVGDKVYYKHEGPTDTGTVVEKGIYTPPAGSPLYGREEVIYGVQWDNTGSESGLIPDGGGFRAGQLVKV